MSGCEGAMFEYVVRPERFDQTVYMCQAHAAMLKAGRLHEVQIVDLVDHGDCMAAHILAHGEPAPEAQP